MKKILLINTGGTFSSRPGECGLSPELTSGDICALLGGVDSALSIEAEDYCSLDSSNITPDDWCRLALRIGEKADSFDGVVLIHGTDTMAYTSSMLSFMLRNIPIPVVVTGSQVPPAIGCFTNFGMKQFTPPSPSCPARHFSRIFSAGCFPPACPRGR